MARGRVWSEAEGNIIRDNYLKLSHKEIAGLLPGRDSLAVRNFCKRYGLLKQPKRSMTDEERQFIEQNYQKMSYKDIGCVLNIRESTVNHFCSRNKLRKGHRMYFYNESFFDEPNITSCYWAGLLAADGSVDLERGVLTLSLKEEDSYQVELFKSAIDYSGPLYHGFGTIDGKKFPRTTLGLNSAWPYIAQLDKHYNIGPRKSLTLGPPNIKDINLLKAYIIGYLDGDGTIELRERKYSLMVGFVGSYGFMVWLKTCFDMWYPAGRSTVVTDHNIFRYRVSGERAHKILRDLSSLEVPFLQRKWNKILGLL